MDNGEPSSTIAVRGQQVFTDLPLYQQVYVTDLVLGPAAAVRLARRTGVDLARYDWWRVALTPQAKRALEAQARDAQRQRKAEASAAREAKRDRPVFDATPYHKARNALGRAK
jgi:hypothetical protein